MPRPEERYIVDLVVPVRVKTVVSAPMGDGRAVIARAGKKVAPLMKALLNRTAENSPVLQEHDVQEIEYLGTIDRAHLEAETCNCPECKKTLWMRLPEDGRIHRVT